MPNKKTTTTPTEAVEQKSFWAKAQDKANSAVSNTAKTFTILDIVCRVALGITVWFVPVPLYVVAAASFLGAIGALQLLRFLWRAQA